MSCKAVNKYLPDYANGELDQTTSSIVAQHVAECVACATELKAYATMREWLAETREALPEGPLPAFGGVRARIEARKTARTRRTRWGWALPAVGLAATAVILAVVWKGPAQSTSPTPAGNVLVAKTQLPPTTKVQAPAPPTVTKMASVTKPKARREHRHVRIALAKAAPRKMHEIPEVVETAGPAPSYLAVELTNNAATGNTEAAVMSRNEPKLLINL